MNADDEVPLLKCAICATQRTADVAVLEAALDDLHTNIFGEATSADVSPGTVLHEISEVRILLSKAAAASKSDYDTGLLLLDAVLTLGEMLANAINGQKTRNKVVKRLEDVVLPILFMRTSVSPSLLKSHALKAPYAAFEAALQKPGKEVEKLELTFASWSANHGWSFGMRRERCLETHKAAAPTFVEAKTSVEKKEAEPERTGNAPERQLTVLRDISWNVALKRSAGAGIPSYLLTKRRHVDSNHPGACSAPPTDVSRVDTPASHNPHTTIDDSDAEAGSTVLALKSPVKRRRIDFSVGIPPSPDRPGRRL